MPFKLNPITGALDLVGEDGAAGSQTELTGDVGAAVSPDGSDSISLIGDATQAFLQTTGTPASNKMEIKLIEPSVDGQLLIGHTANGEPSAATLTAGGGVTITNGAGSITIAADDPSDLSVPTDSGTATSSSNSLSIVGGTGVDTAGSGSTVTINADANVPTTFTTDSGTGTPAGNSLAVNGGTGINTSGSGAGITINLDNPVIAAQGGSGRQSHTAYAVICGGTTSTSAQQSIASVGTAAQVLTSNGAGALPTMQALPDVESISTSLTAGSVVFSDGSNLAQDNANFFWDDTNNRLGIGTTSPLDELHIVGSCDIVHTATENDDHALEIDVIAGGFSDIKGVDINYATGAVTAGDSEEAIIVNIDESASLGGEVFGIEILSTAEGSATIYGTKHGASVNPILHDSGVFADADTILNKAVDVTAALADGGAGNITMFVADDDTITIGDAATFGELEIILDTGASGSGIAPTFEYSTGVGTWSSFGPSDGTNGFRNTGLISWETLTIPTWAPGTGSEYLIRITRTRNSLSTAPIVDKIQKAAITEYTWDKDGLITIDKIVSLTNLTVGNTTEDTSFTINGASITSTISAESTASSDLGGLISHRHSATAGFGGHYVGLRSRGTHDSPSIVSDNDTLSILAAAGHDGTDYALAAQISVEVDGTPGADDMPGRIIMSTSADGAQTPTEGLRLDSSQIVTLANALPETSGGTNQTTYTTGDILYSDGANSLAKLGIGSAGQVLEVSGGVPAWGTGSSGAGIVFLASGTASASSSLDFTSSIDSTYNTYMFVLDHIRPASTDDLTLLTSSDGGSSFETTSYLSLLFEAASGTNTVESTTKISLSESQSSSAAHTLSGIVYLHNPAASTTTYVTGQYTYRDSTSNRTIGLVGSFRNVAESVDAVRFIYDGGNMTSGTISMYGMTTPS